ncbi:hypothetical protein BC829DRAFT_136696 [Chytridium lagenaria]|nr:hypothetical protein BC829DRAFT_136696 [Chytridium lagenaria]
METSRPFSCNQCSRAFNRQEHLIRHLRIHSGEKPFQCSVCMKKFSRSDELVRHARLHARAADSAAYAAAVAAAVTNLPSTPALSPTASAATSIVGDQDSSSAVTSPEIEQAFLPSSSQRRFSFDTQHPLPSSLQTMTEMEHSSQSSSTQRRFSLDARPPLPPSSEKAYGSFATSYPRRMSLCSYRDDVEPEAVSSTLSTSAPVTAPLLPRLSSSYSFTSHSTQLNQNIASHNYNLGPIQPSHIAPALQEALSFESGSFPGSTSISDSRRMSTQSNSYIPVHDMSETILPHISSSNSIFPQMNSRTILNLHNRFIPNTITVQTLSTPTIL